MKAATTESELHPKIRQIAGAPNVFTGEGNSMSTFSRRLPTVSVFCRIGFFAMRGCAFRLPARVEWPPARVRPCWATYVLQVKAVKHKAARIRSFIISILRLAIVINSPPGILSVQWSRASVRFFTTRSKMITTSRMWPLLPIDSKMEPDREPAYSGG